MLEGMLGESISMLEVFNTVIKAARSNAPILILGESGTGKEMVANAIHRRSPFKDKPFVAINCNAIPESLLESELFGYEKGAFTGANSQRTGLIEEAMDGTLFLDEIGDIPLPVQVKLLRFLQEKRIQRIGGRMEIDVECRVLAATHVDLDSAIHCGSFREDLYFRLAVVVCKIPPLRDRGKDVLLLANKFLRHFSEQNGRNKMAFSQGAIRLINQHHWSGNVRELQNRIQRAVIMADESLITESDLEIELNNHNIRNGRVGEQICLSEFIISSGLKSAREHLEREMLRLAMKKHHGNISAAARELGITRPTFYELMNKLHVTKNL